MHAIEPNFGGLAIFSGLWLVCCAGFFLLSEMLPLSAAPASLQTSSGWLLIAVDTALLLGLLVLTIVFGYSQVRWSSMIVAGGAIFLFAPFMIQGLPETLKSGKAGLAMLLFLILIALAVVIGTYAYPGFPSLL